MCFAVMGRWPVHQSRRSAPALKDDHAAAEPAIADCAKLDWASDRFTLAGLWGVPATVMLFCAPPGAGAASCGLGRDADLDGLRPHPKRPPLRPHALPLHRALLPRDGGSGDGSRRRYGIAWQSALVVAGHCHRRRQCVHLVEYRAHPRTYSRRHSRRSTRRSGSASCRCARQITALVLGIMANGAGLTDPTRPSLQVIGNLAEPTGLGQACCGFLRIARHGQGADARMSDS